jgi:capsular exopolysaccharide synthesis family protein
MNSKNLLLGTDVPRPSGTEDRSGEVKLSRVLQIIFRRKLLVVSTALATAGLLATYAYLATPVYTAEVLIATNQPAFGQFMVPLAVAPQSQATELMTEIDLITSPAFIRRIAERFDLARDPEFNGPDWEQKLISKGTTYIQSILPADLLGTKINYGTARDTATPSLTADMQRSQLIRTISRHLGVSNDGRSLTIRLKFSSSDPDKASKVANALAAEYVKNKAEVRTQLWAAAKATLSQERPTTDVLGSPLIQRLREEEGLLKAQYESIVAASGPNYARAQVLRRQIDALSQTIKAESEKITNALASDVTAQSDARIISPALSPDRPSYPRMDLFVGAGLLLGAFFGTLGALRAESSERTFTTIRAIENVTGLPALSLVPAIRGRRKVGATKLDLYYDESISRVRAILSHPGHNVQTKIVAVTSALPQEGKSTFCAAIGRSAARSGMRVLVVEFDFHCPSLLQVFDQDPGPGDLTDLITGTKTFQEVVRTDRLSGVDFIPIINRTKESQQLINSTQMRMLFQHFSESYDLVIVDTPPVMATADIAALSGIIDTCLFVVCWDKTPRDAVMSGLRQLYMFDVPVGGIVATRVDPKKTKWDAEGKYYSAVMDYHLRGNSV